jgi:hypothetical protein
VRGTWIGDKLHDPARDTPRPGNWIVAFNDGPTAHENLEEVVSHPCLTKGHAITKGDRRSVGHVVTNPRHQIVPVWPRPAVVRDHVPTRRLVPRRDHRRQCHANLVSTNDEPHAGRRPTIPSTLG